MRTKIGHLTHVTIAMGALILAMTATPTYAGSSRSLTIRAAAVSGNEVATTVANHTSRTQTGTLRARILMSYWGSRVLAAVTAAAGQTATVRIVLPAAVEDELPVSVVVDDGVPF